MNKLLSVVIIISLLLITILACSQDSIIYFGHTKIDLTNSEYQIDGSESMYDAYIELDLDDSTTLEGE